MSAAMKVESETVELRSIWFELCVEGRSHIFELQVEGARAITVGSSIEADVCLNHPGVAPVQFYVEREENALWVVPAYNAQDLRIDSALANGPSRIEGSAIVECARVRVHVSLLERDELETRASSMNERPARQGERTDRAAHFASASVPLGCSTPKTLGIDPFRDVSNGDANVHEETPPTLRTSEALPQLRSVTFGPRTLSDVPTSDTIKMAPFWIDPQEPGCIVKHDSKHKAAWGASMQAASCHAAGQPITRANELGGQWPLVESGLVTVFEPVRGVDALLDKSTDSGSQGTTVFDVPRLQAPQPRVRGWLAKLGVLTQRRPLFVWLAGTTAAFALSASIGWAVKHAYPWAQSAARQSSPLAPSAVASARASRTVVATNHSMRADVSTVPRESIVIVREVSASAKSGRAKDPELAAAVGHLMAGRISDAREAFATLATRTPDAQSLVVMARLLAEKVDPKCLGSAPKTTVACPEVHP